MPWPTWTGPGFLAITAHSPEEQEHSRREALEVGVVIDVNLILYVTKEVHPNDGLYGYVRESAMGEVSRI